MRTKLDHFVRSVGVPVRMQEPMQAQSPVLSTKPNRGDEAVRTPKAQSSVQSTTPHRVDVAVKTPKSQSKSPFISLTPKKKVMSSMDTTPKRKVVTPRVTISSYFSPKSQDSKAPTMVLSSPSTSQGKMNPFFSSRMCSDIRKVPCPVCQVLIVEQYLNKHLDQCLQTEKQKPK